LGNPREFVLTGGECADISVAPELLQNVSGCFVIADKAYDSDKLVQDIESKGCQAVIPPRSNRVKLRSYDRHVYKERHLVENFFNKIKEYRRIATRYDKLATTFLAFVHLAAAIIWIR